MINNDKYGANSTSIFVPIKHKALIDQIIDYQNTQQGDNGEFIASIEIEFGWSDEVDSLLVTTQYEVFKDVARKLFDDATLLGLLFGIVFPIVDDDTYIKEAARSRNIGNVWFCNDWLFTVPLPVHHVATSICDEYNLQLICITPNSNVNFTAVYNSSNSNYHYINFTFIDGVVTKTTFD